MLSRRNWVLRLSIVLNVIVLCYVGTHFVSYNNGVELVEDIQATAGRNLAVIEYNTNSNKQNFYVQGHDVGKSFYTETKRYSESSDRVQESVRMAVRDGNIINQSHANVQLNKTSDIQNTGEETAKDLKLESVVMPIPSKQEQIMKSVNDELKASTVYSDGRQNASLPKTLEEVIKCHDRDQIRSTAQRGDFWVLYNYIKPSRSFRCFETVTYTTHSDYTFLDNLEPLLERWRGPVSLAMHAPGSDFNATINTIQYLRKCGSSLVSQLVTFHIYFGSKYVPKKIPKPEEVEKLQVNCSLPPPWTNVTTKQLFKTQKKILYPINVGRNIAREAAVTYYILASDIELYPSPNLIDDFLELVRRQDPPLLRKNPKVFALPIFELEAGAAVPINKMQLVQMLKSGKAIPFHKKVCPGCHSVPKSKEWLQTNETKGLHVFYIGKRMGYHIHWEPIYIGTHKDPFYDERLSWEGKSDKMTQGYALCVLDYEFHILDNAFLVHKPGIKTVKKDTARAILASKTNSLIQKVILPELRILYGIKKGCAV